jgi:hypothetical protein
LTGTLPPWNESNGTGGALPELQTLHINCNKGLTGTIPGWSSLRKIKIFSVADNGLSGTMPSWTTWSDGLEDISIRDQALSGTFPVEWSRFTNMKGMWIHNTYISGTIPPEWRSMENLQTLWMQDDAKGGYWDGWYGSHRGTTLCTFLE